MTTPSAPQVALRMAETTFQRDITLDRIRHDMAVFVAEREWEKFHTPRNILLALAGEVGEVAECFQWKGDEGSQHLLPAWTEKEKVHLGEELSDVLLYLVRLSDICGVDLAAAALRKMTLNRAKYPADKARGRSDKYTAYMEDKAAAASNSSAAASVSTGTSAADGQVGAGASLESAPAEGTAAGTAAGFSTPRKAGPAEPRTPSIKESPTNPEKFAVTLSHIHASSGGASTSGTDSTATTPASTGATSAWDTFVHNAAATTGAFIPVVAFLGMMMMVENRLLRRG